MRDQPADTKAPLIARRTCSVCEMPTLEVRRVVVNTRPVDVARCTICDVACCSACKGYTDDPTARTCKHCKAVLPMSCNP